MPNVTDRLEREVWPPEDDIEYAARQLTTLPNDAHRMSTEEILSHAVDMGEEILGALRCLREREGLADCPVCDAGRVAEAEDGEFYCSECGFRGRACHTNRGRVPTTRSYVSYDDELQVEHGRLATYDKQNDGDR